MTETLKPCPFCLSDEFTRVEADCDGDDDAWHVYCDNCSTCGPYGRTEDEAVFCWNQRGEL